MANISVKAYLKLCIMRVMKSPALDMELFFLALADRTRLRLLSLIDQDEVCVCFFVEVLKTNQPKISRHLAYLRKAGLVSARRQGKWMHYRVTPPTELHAKRIFDQVMTWLREDDEMKKDQARLASICCSPRPPVQIQGAPRPARLSA